MKAWTRHLDVAVQVLLWAMALLSPFLGVLFSEQSLGTAFVVTGYALPYVLYLMLVFYANYFFFIPRFLFRKQYWAFVLGNVGLVWLLKILRDAVMQWQLGETPPIPAGMRVASDLLGTLVIVLFILAAIALRVQKRNQQLEMEAAVAERERLKSQLNPHFLFNTLNNISSLAAFDPDATQASISRLSDMLRYVLYEGSKPATPIRDEMAFMEDYVELMRLRYADTLKVSLALEPVEGELPPLLYISLLENAFKHGASSRHACYIRASFGEEEGGWLCFTVANSLLPPEERQASGRAGGVGIENLRRRLRLLYKEADYSLVVGERAGLPFEEEMLDIPAYEASLRIKTKR